MNWWGLRLVKYDNETVNTEMLLTYDMNIIINTELFSSHSTRRPLNICATDYNSFIPVHK